MSLLFLTRPYLRRLCRPLCVGDGLLDQGLFQHISLRDQQVSCLSFSQLCLTPHIFSIATRDIDRYPGALTFIIYFTPSSYRLLHGCTTPQWSTPRRAGGNRALVTVPHSAPKTPSGLPTGQARSAPSPPAGGTNSPQFPPKACSFWRCWQLHHVLAVCWLWHLPRRPGLVQRRCCRIESVCVSMYLFPYIRARIKRGSSLGWPWAHKMVGWLKVESEGKLRVIVVKWRDVGCTKIDLVYWKPLSWLRIWQCKASTSELWGVSFATNIVRLFHWSGRCSVWQRIAILS